MRLVKSGIKERVSLRDFSMRSLGLSQAVGGPVVSVVTEIYRATNAQNPLLERGYGMIWSFLPGSPWKKQANEFLVCDEQGEPLDPPEYVPGAQLLDCVIDGADQQWVLSKNNQVRADTNKKVITFAGIWVPDDRVRDIAHGLPQDAWQPYFEEVADIACEAFTAWLCGDVWRYLIKAYQHVQGGQAHDYNHEAMVEDECEYLFGRDLEVIVADVELEVALEAANMLHRGEAKSFLSGQSIGASLHAVASN